jgi:hypothetical protein
MNDSCAHCADESERISNGDHQFAWARSFGGPKGSRRQAGGIHLKHSEIGTRIVLQYPCRQTRTVPKFDFRCRTAHHVSVRKNNPRWIEYDS